MTLKSVLDSLKPEQYRRLMFAFEHDIEQWVVLENNKFLGVNIVRVPFLVPDPKMTAGRWCYGDVKQPESKMK